jgi:hypothetical protein
MIDLPAKPHPRYSFLDTKKAFLISSLLFTPFIWIFEPSGVVFVSFLLANTNIGVTGIAIISSFYFMPSVFLSASQSLLSKAGSHKGRAVVFGCAGVTIISSSALAPFLLSSPRSQLWGFIAVVFTGNLIVLFSRQALTSWKNSLLSDPSGIPFLHKLDLQMLATAIVSLIIAGLFVDFAGKESYWSFCMVFAFVFYSGWVSFQLLNDISDSVLSHLHEKNALNPHLNETAFTPSYAFAIRFIISFSLGLLMPFFSVFLLESQFLGIGLARAALLVSIQIFFFAVGNIVWEKMKERYGSFPILRLGMFIEGGIIFLLIFIVAWNTFFLPFIAAISGLALSGIKVSLMSIIPEQDSQPEEKISFLAGGYFYGFAAAAGAFLGAIIFHLAERPFPAVFSEWKALHIIFLISSLLFLGTAVLLSFNSRRTDKPLKSMAHDLFEGNPFLFMFYSLALLFAKTELLQVQAIIGLGKSKSPLAVETLSEALDDAIPEVRKNAALALGKIKSVSALPPLIAELENHESDLRCEAAESLGKIGSRYAVPNLLRALDDEDVRVQKAAVTALAEIGGDKIRETLVMKFSGSYDNDMFPILADGLSRLGVTEIVEPVMSRLGSYQSIVFRLQLLNAVCRVLGAGNTFYRVLSKHEYQRVNEVNKIIRHAQKNVQRSPLFKREPVANINRILESIAHSYREEDDKTFLASVWEFMACIQLVIPEIMPQEERRNFSHETGRPTLLPYLEAVNRFLQLKKTEDIKDEGMVFLVICIDCLLNAL